MKYAVILGGNYVNSELPCYGGWDGKLQGPSSDHKLVHELCLQGGITEPNIYHLQDEESTSKNFEKVIDYFASMTKAGDTVMVYYTGHAGQQINKDAMDEEVDGKDEFLCLYDGLYLDDQVYKQLCKFALGVNLFVAMDACHSETAVRDVTDRVVKSAPTHVQQPTQVRTSPTGWMKVVGEIPMPGLSANLVFLAACKERKYSYDTAAGGQFTIAMSACWNTVKPREKDTYRTLKARINRHKLMVRQTASITTNSVKLLNSKPLS